MKGQRSRTIQLQLIQKPYISTPSGQFMKCRYMDGLTDNKGTIFASGTPISNSMSEMFTMQRYLQYDTLTAKNLSHFDAWASIFGETVTSIELAPDGRRMSHFMIL